MKVSLSRTLSALNQLECASVIDAAHLEGLAYTIDLIAKRLRKTPSAICERLAPARSPKTLARVLQNILNEIPLGTHYPPKRIGHLHRVDDGSELADFARRTRHYKNLETDVSWGLAVAYRSPSNLDAMYVLRRRGRLGWFFQGPVLARGVSLSRVQIAKAEMLFAKHNFDDGTKTFLAYQFLYNQLGYHDVPSVKSLSIPVFL